MPKSRKGNKRKHKRKYGQQDKVVFKRVVRWEVVQQERPLTLKEKVALFRSRQQAVQESAERLKSIQEKITPPGMAFSEYLQYIEKKKEEVLENENGFDHQYERRVRKNHNSGEHGAYPGEALWEEGSFGRQ